MNSDLQPLEAPAPESHGAPVEDTAEGCTLTLPLRPVPGAMLGRLVMRETAASAADTVRLRVALPPQEPLNFTA